jgi:tetratricopeptide (TPR) repeat protein
MLPLDYADRGVARQRRNVGRLIGFTSLVIVAIGAFRLSQSLKSEEPIGFHLIEIAVLFSLAFIISDLSSYDGRKRTRLASISSISWPILIGLASSAEPDFRGLASGAILTFLAIVLHEYSRSAFSSTAIARRFRALLGMIGLATAVAIMISQASEIMFAAISTLVIAALLMFDILRPDPSLQGRRDLFNRIDSVEIRILEINEAGIRLDHASSLLKLAREEGWSNTSRGHSRLKSVEHEIELALSMDRDLSEIREAVMVLVNQAESIAPEATESVSLVEKADSERALGSPREAETIYREAKKVANRICLFWEPAREALSEAEKKLEKQNIIESDTIAGMVESARKAMERQRPDEALHFLEALPDQLQSLSEALDRVRARRSEISSHLVSEHPDISEEVESQLSSIDKSIEDGELSLAMGGLESIARRLHNRSESRRSFKQSVRQKGMIQSRFPLAEKTIFEKRLGSAISLSKEGLWIQADEELKSIINDLDSVDATRRDTEELLDFLEGEWKILRKKLESSGVGPDDSTRRLAEKHMAIARENFEKDSFQASRNSMGSADEAMESLRRLV